MNIKSKIVFYCEYCKKYRLSYKSMEKHELHCTMNPDRICNWHQEVFNIKPLINDLNRYKHLSSHLIDGISFRINDCPACLLAILRQSHFKEYHWDDNGIQIFDYDKCVQEWRRNENL